MQRYKTMELRSLGTRDPQNWYFGFILVDLHHSPDLHRNLTDQGKVSIWSLNIVVS